MSHLILAREGEIETSMIGEVHKSHNSFDYTFPLSLSIKDHKLKVYFKLPKFLKKRTSLFLVLKRLTLLLIILTHP